MYGRLAPLTPVLFRVQPYLLNISVGHVLSWNIGGSKRDMVSPPWNAEKRKRLTNCKHHNIVTEIPAAKKYRWCRSPLTRESRPSGDTEGHASLDSWWWAWAKATVLTACTHPRGLQPSPLWYSLASLTFGDQRPGFKFQLYHLLAMCPIVIYTHQASVFSSLK